ncbi:MAG TPA: type II toxin-antitoxin system RelE/ParE family toxin [Stellaceae bacterium]|nr:type II toxin-antitoxin system RelE/ParE family toxin [Stellaceae bacterium]
MTSADWEVELSSAAEADLRQIVRWTARQFGSAQAAAYGQLLRDALKALEAGPNIIGARRREEIGAGYRTLHIARNRRRARHFILFRVVDPAEERVIRVVRILHDAMDPARHLSGEEE